MIRLVLFLFFLVSGLSAQLILENGKKIYNDFEIEYLYDDTGIMGINNVVNTKFQNKTANSFTFGYIDGTTWFKLTLINRSEEENFILHFSEAIWKKFNLYEYKGESWVKTPNGLDVNLSNRSVKDIHPAFKLEIKPGSSKTFYVEGNTIASQIGEFEIYTAQEYYDPSKFTLMHIYLIFAFSLFSILLLNIYSYLLTKEKIYIYYIGYIYAFIVFSAMHSGFYLLLGFEGWNEGLHVVGAFVILTLLLFSNSFLELEKYLPVIHRFFNISAVVFLIFAFLIFNNIPYSGLFFNFYSALFFFVLFYAAIKIYILGKNPAAKYYLIALIIYAPLMSLMILTFNGILQYSDFTRHSFLVGAFWEILLFTLILAGRYRALNLEKIELQNSLLKEKEDRQRYLEVQVNEKTKDIQEIINKFQFATDNALAGYWEINLDTNDINLSKGWYRFLGYDEERNGFDKMQNVMEDIIYEDDKAKVKKAVYDYINKKVAEYNIEFRVKHKEGNYTWVKAVGSIYNNKFFGFHIDINSLYNANLRLVEQAKLAEMGEMIGNIAHQWRQPLSVISVASTGMIVKKENGLLDDKELIENLTTIDNSAQYLSQTIDTFRSYIKEKKEFKEVVLQERIRIALDVLKASFQNNHIKIIHNLDDTEPMKIELVVGELTEVIINILSNAKDALVEKDIPDPFVQISLKQKEDKVLICIKDNAGGIPEDIMHKIFEPYFTTKHQTMGTGLGLHMSYKIVNESLGGKIYAQNLNGGAAFYIELPLNSSKG